MKKVTLLTIILFLCAQFSYSQSEPGKRETFNFIADKIEAACRLGKANDFEVIDRDEDKFEITVKRAISKLGYDYGYYISKYTLKSLKNVNINADSSVLEFEWNHEISESRFMGDGRKITPRPGGLTIEKRSLRINSCSPKDAGRLLKAGKHFIKLMDGSGNFFDDN